jgi:hypothetical protein
VQTNFFIVEIYTNPIILRNPFLTDTRARLKYASNSLTYCQIYSEDRQNSTKFIYTRGDRVNALGLYTGLLVGNIRGV